MDLDESNRILVIVTNVWNFIQFEVIFLAYFALILYSFTFKYAIDTFLVLICSSIIPLFLIYQIINILFHEVMLIDKLNRIETKQSTIKQSS